MTHDQSILLGDRVLYCRVKKERQNYKGERYFRWVPGEDKVLQIVVRQGQKKKGRSEAIGIYQISRVTFASNYCWNNAYLETVTKKEFKSAYWSIVNRLIIPRATT